MVQNKKIERVRLLGVKTTLSYQISFFYMNLFNIFFFPSAECVKHKTFSADVTQESEIRKDTQWGEGVAGRRRGRALIHTHISREPTGRSRRR